MDINRFIPGVSRRKDNRNFKVMSKDEGVLVKSKHFRKMNKQ